MPNVDEVYWTLYVELKFYILMALAFRFRLLQHIEKICAGWLALAVIAAVFDFAAHPLGYVLHDLFILEWAPFFLAGICFYLVWSGRISRLVLALIAATCAACHGQDARGNPLLGAPNLSDDIWLHGGSTEQIRQTVMFGRQGAMPAHKQRLSETEIRLLAAYVYRLSGQADQ